jgi:hypothetical protein
MVERNGFREYYNPLNGEGLGARHFGWSTLLVDLLPATEDLDFEGLGHWPREGSVIGEAWAMGMEVGSEIAGLAGRMASGAWRLRCDGPDG